MGGGEKLATTLFDWAGSLGDGRNGGAGESVYRN